jgi:hypothetical protein
MENGWEFGRRQGVNMYCTFTGVGCVDRCIDELLNSKNVLCSPDDKVSTWACELYFSWLHPRTAYIIFTPCLR